MNSAEQSLIQDTSNLTLDPIAGAITSAPPDTAQAAFRAHWPEYLMEAGLLGAFMVSACVFGALYEFPHSPVREWITSKLLRRMLMGASMGLTAIAIIYSPWGKQSGAHINPSVTFTFFRLGKIKAWDALFYITSQFAVHGTTLLESSSARPLHGLVRWTAGRNLHHVGSAILRHEHESRADIRLGLLRGDLEWSVDLPHCPTAWNAGGG
jgi:hypothetical protein